MPPQWRPTRSHFRSASFTRTCQPGPVARRLSIRSASSRIVTCRFGDASLGLPRPRLSRSATSAGWTSWAGRSTAVSRSGALSGSALAAATTLASSSGSAAAIARRAFAFARAFLRAITSRSWPERMSDVFGIAFALLRGRGPETDRVHLVVRPQRVDEEVQPMADEADGSEPLLTFGVSIVFDQGGLEFKTYGPPRPQAACAR